MANQLGKGPKLEYIITGLFQNEGYLSRRSIPLYYGNKNQDATDIDVLGIVFTKPFQMHKIICDCKNKQKSKPYERIFWVKGLSQFVNAEQTYVSLPQASWEISKFAQDGGVRVLTGDIINQYFSGNSNLFGIADDTFYVEFFDKFNNTIKKNKNLYTSANALKALYLNEDPYVSVNVAMETLSVAGKHLKLSKENNLEEEYSFWKYICCESMIIISLSILNICSDTICLPIKARKERILTKLTYGDIEPFRINTILNYAKNVANEIIKENIPRNMISKLDLVDFGQITPPSYASTIIGIVERAIKNQEWYINLPQVLDFILFEFAVKNKEFSMDDFKKVFNSDNYEGKLKAAKNILSLARNICNIDLKLLWGNNKGIILSTNEELDLKEDKRMKEEFTQIDMKIN